MRKYTVILSLLVFSLLGTLMTQFCLAVWVTKNYESTFVYTLIVFFGVAPPILLSPIIGSFVDRWDKRKTIILANLVAGIASLCLILLYEYGVLSPWKVMVFAAIGSLADRFMSMAFNVSTIGLVTRKRLSKARGLLQSSIAFVTLASPILAPVLLSLIGLNGVFLFEMITFVITVVVMQFVRMDVSTEPSKKIGLKKDAKVVFNFLKSEKGLLTWMGYNFLIVFMIGLVSVMLAPLMLDFSDEKSLGIIMSLGGLGMLLGGISMSIYKGFSNPVITSINTNTILSFLFLVIAFWFNHFVIGLAISLIMVCHSVIKTVDSTFWLTIIPEHLQGRVLGYQILIIGLATPLAYLTSGLLIDLVLLPLVENIEYSKYGYPGSAKTTAIVFLLFIAGIFNMSVSLIVRTRRFIKRLDSLYERENQSRDLNIQLNEETV